MEDDVEVVTDTPPPLRGCRLDRSLRGIVVGPQVEGGVARADQISGGVGLRSGGVGLGSGVLLPVALPAVVHGQEIMTSLERVVGPWRSTGGGICILSLLVRTTLAVIVRIGGTLGLLLFTGRVLRTLCSRGDRLTG